MTIQKEGVTVVLPVGVSLYDGPSCDEEPRSTTGNVAFRLFPARRQVYRNCLVGEFTEEGKPTKTLFFPLPETAASAYQMIVTALGATESLQHHRYSRGPRSELTREGLAVLAQHLIERPDVTTKILRQLLTPFLHAEDMGD